MRYFLLTMITFSRVELQGLFQILDVTENATYYETSQ